MANKVVTETYGAPEKQILIGQDSYFNSLSAVIKDTGVSADTNGKKIVKAGTPLYGDIEDRDAGFAISGEGNPVGIILHDTDVTAGDENGTIVLAGCVDLLKLETAVQSSISSVKSYLPRIIFVKGSAI